MGQFVVVHGDHGGDGGRQSGGAVCAECVRPGGGDVGEVVEREEADVGVYRVKCHDS